MTPAQARRWIAELEILGMRFGLERMGALLEQLGHPQRAAPALHIVGTNGKSSTARLASAAVASQGHRVGTYLSPHVTDWNERVQIEGAPVGDGAFAAAATAVRRAADRLGLTEGDAVTQFEALTAIAFWAFREAGVRFCVIEAGLGGRYDATNVLRPDAVVVLTNIALEHTELLGDTEAQIAAEKLAVCPDGATRLVVGRLSDAGRGAVVAECGRRGLVPLYYGDGLRAAEGEGGVDVTTPRGVYAAVPLGLLGGFQRDNLAVALAAAELLLGAPLGVEPLRSAIGAVQMPGRLEMFSGAPAVLLDGAHNPAGMQAMVQALPALVRTHRPVVALISVLGDKDAGAMLDALGDVADLIIATRSRHARAVPADQLADIARAQGHRVEAVADPVAALDAARTAAGPGGIVVVAGSLYLLRDLRPRLTAVGASAPAKLARARKGNDPYEAK